MRLSQDRDELRANVNRRLIFIFHKIRVILDYQSCNEVLKSDTDPRSGLIG